jgi:hypothetical protein
MSLNVKTSTGLKRIHSVRIKGEGLPVTFLKSIKSVGNSIIPTDIVPSYDWITAMDVYLNEYIQSAEGHSSGVMGTMKTVDGTPIGYYAISASREGNTLWFLQGNNWDQVPEIYFYAYESRNTIYMRRDQNAGCTFGQHYVINHTTANATNLTDTPIAFLGQSSNTDGVISYLPNASRGITIYGVRLYNASGTLLHNLIPAQSKTTGRGGLYDIITGTFYSSSTDFDDVIKEA